MRMVAGELYHIYNRGNNRERLFYTDEHFRFFKEKMRRHICPYANLLAYCLMPNHFHLLVQATEATCIPYYPKKRNEGSMGELAVSKMSVFAHGVQTALSSYARGFNQMHRRSGSLFTQNTRAKRTSAPAHQMDYSLWCFIYIHQNPVRAGLVDVPEAWKWSSYREYLGVSTDNLCQTGVGTELLSLEINELIQFNRVGIPHQIITQIF